MIEITETIDNNTNKKPFKKNEKTKLIIIDSNEVKYNSDYEILIAKSNTYSIYYQIKNSIEKSIIIPTTTIYKIIIKENNTEIKEIIIHDSRHGDTGMSTFLIESSEELTILNDFNNLFYYNPLTNPIQLKPMPKIDKLIDSSSFENVSTKLQEINNLLKVSSDNLKTIMDANNLMYEPTDSFSTLVKKLNNEPINFLLEGTKIRSIFGKYLSIYPSAPPAGVEYYHLEFTNIKNDSWIDLKEDLSLKQDGSISLYKESINDGRNDQTTYYIYSENKIYANIDSSYMFNLGLSMIDSINFKNLYVDYVENASHLFENISGDNGDCPLCSMINFLNLRFKNIKNINYMFNHYDLAGENHFRVESNNIINYSNFCENHDWNNGYNYLILDYINDKTKKIAETIVSESNNNVKLGTLVTQ